MRARHFLSFSQRLIAYFVVGMTLLGSPSAEAAVAKRCESVFAASYTALPEITNLEGGSNSFADADQAARRLLALSPKQQRRAVESMLRIYRNVPKRILNPMLARRYGGRRLFDRVLSLVNRYDLQFKQMTGDGLGPREAFTRIFESQAALIGTRYSVDDIDAILRVLKTDLAVQQQRVGRYPLKYLVGGSFANGKASLIESDVDISVNNPELKNVGREWEGLIAQTLSSRHEFTNLAVELHMEPASFYGKLNPFVFEVAADGIKLYVFPPASNSSENGQLTSQTPDVYDWK